MYDTFCRAIDYTDGWFDIPGTGSRFRTYYLCKGGVGGGNKIPCGSVQLSSRWARLKDNALVAGPRWYCKVCGSKYRVKYGVMVEMVSNNQTFYMKAEFPTQEIEDLKRMAVDQLEKHGDLTVSEEFLTRFPDAHPCSENSFRKTEFEGVYRLHPEFLAKLPMLDRDLVYRSVGKKK